MGAQRRRLTTGPASRPETIALGGRVGLESRSARMGNAARVDVDSVSFAPVVARLCPLFLSVPTYGAGRGTPMFLTFEIPPATGHASNSSSNEDDGQDPEYQDIEHDSVHHTRGASTLDGNDWGSEGFSGRAVNGNGSCHAKLPPILRRPRSLSAEHAPFGRLEIHRHRVRLLVRPEGRSVRGNAQPDKLSEWPRPPSRVSATSSVGR